MSLSLSSTFTSAAKIFICFTIGIASYELIKSQSDSRSIDPKCALSSIHCTIDDATLSLAKDKVNPMVSNTLSVEWNTLPTEVDSLMLSLEGHEMMMGTYKLLLKRSADNTFSGDLLLPVCTSDAMTWLGTITPINDTSHASPLPISVRMTQ
ncbi:hypothetical protein [Photobacterium sanguinicancri]|nr:hypothetical protein [Photobacterium sanguinicancri]